MALLANPLHKYATFNYVWTLSAMYPGEVNDPKEYVGKTGKLPIVTSGGVGNRKTTTTQAEEKINKNVEYFIDDMIINTTAGPNIDAPTSTVADFSFKVYEPYSLGLFLQTMSLAASRAGFTNYQYAPYLLSLQFKGFYDDGTFEEVTSKQFVIMISSVSITADGSGSIYEVRALPYNHNGLAYPIQSLKEDITLEGETVGEILSYGPKSLAVYLNDREIRNARSQFKIIPDQYQVAFPFDISPDSAGFYETGPLGGIGRVLNDIQSGLNRVNNTVSAIGNVGNSLANLGSVLSNLGSVNSVGQAQRFNPGNYGGLNASPTPSVKVASTLESIGESITQLASSIALAGISSQGNEIGSSAMIDSFNEFGNVAFELEDATWDANDGIFKRGNMSVSATKREYTFAAGTTIEQIVESIILLSKWGQQFVSRPVDKSGLRPWYRIKTKTYILSLAEMEAMGRPAFRFLYEVYPYFIHQSAVSLPFASNDIDILIDDAVKAYNYVYTGLNRDILNFEINFDNIYSAARPADNNQGNVTRLTSLGGSAVAEGQPALTMPTDAGAFSDTLGQLRATITELTNLYRIAGGTFIDTDRTRAANTFRNLLLNNSSDLQTILLTIWGDPYYLNSSDAGNYVSKTLRPFINEDLEIDYHRSQAFVLVKFNTPADYNNNLLLADPADQFTGVYMVQTIEHQFQGGQFKQVLNLTRVANQPPSSIAKLKLVIDSFFAGLGALSNLASVVGATDVAAGLNNFMQEASPVANQLLGLAQIGSNLSDIVKGDYQTLGDALVGLESFFGNVQQLESQFRNTIQSLGSVDFNKLTPPTSPRPLPRPPRL